MKGYGMRSETYSRWAAHAPTTTLVDGQRNVLFVGAGLDINHAGDIEHEFQLKRPVETSYLREFDALAARARLLTSRVVFNSGHNDSGLAGGCR